MSPSFVRAGEEYRRGPAAGVLGFLPPSGRRDVSSRVMPATDIVRKNARCRVAIQPPQGVRWRNVRSRHWQVPELLRRRSRHIAPSVQRWKTAYRPAHGNHWLHKIFRKKGSLETLVSSGFLVTFSAAKKSLRPEAELTPRPEAEIPPRPQARNSPAAAAKSLFRSPQHIFAPAGMASSSMTRLSFSAPFSLWTAEISMPQLSRPIILRGGRLTIASSVLPTRASGS